MIRAIGDAYRQAREDAGLSQRQVARLAGISQSYLVEIEAGRATPNVATLTAIAQALGGDLSLRFYPGTGPSIRDHLQARMVEAVIRVLDDRWTPYPEVPVRSPVAGVIDLVLAERRQHLLVASEFHSQLRRLEQQIRWAREKADGLANTPIGVGAGHGSPTTTHRLLVLRSTQTMRSLASDFEATLSAAYPARTAGLVDSLTGTAEWPGSGVIWVRIDGARTHLLERPPPGVRLGR